MSEYTDAVAALQRVDRVERAALRGSSWYARYLLVFGVTQLMFVPVFLLWTSMTVFVVALSVFLLMVAALIVYAIQQRAVRRNFGLRHSITIGSWALVHTAMMTLVGLGGLRGSVPFAVGGALACATPPLVGALLEKRRAA
ncbi:hypothetical protein ACH4SP_25405 [Streptomyces sp. NPDC021093]|uniref:hypothetical protein n=1 Tax=Streptomyces sp. NPDC021093 TaxID=3365112 RepID=UPI00379E395A